MNRSSAMHAVFECNRNVCINVLPGHHELLARHFAGLTQLPMDARFSLPLWDEGRNGVPVLRDALASLQGTIVELKEVGSHSVLFVEAAQIRVHRRRQPHLLRSKRPPRAEALRGVSAWPRILGASARNTQTVLLPGVTFLATR
jgi:flavin reductase (DIM6/NTAB) family NADH-FMN oxidoreductase RutF